MIFSTKLLKWEPENFHPAPPSLHVNRNLIKLKMYMHSLAPGCILNHSFITTKSDRNYPNSPDQCSLIAVHHYFLFRIDTAGAMELRETRIRDECTLRVADRCNQVAVRSFDV
jgi:hypothetical protein